MARGSFTRKALLVERLENRELMAGDVTASLQGQMLVISGDGADNGVTLTYSSTARTFRVAGSDTGAGPTTINGLDTSQPGNVVEFAGVQQVYVGLGYGNDSFEVGSPAAVDTVIQKWFTIEMGDGDDEVTLGSAGNAPSGSAPVARGLNVGTSLKVDLGAGDDDLSVANSRVGLNLSILGDIGNDQITFDTAFTPTGATEPTLFPVKVLGNTLVSLGGGADHLILANASIRGDIVILDGAGVADIKLSNVAVNGRISINTAGDADNLNIEMTRANGLSINTNNGIDHVRLNKTQFDSLNVKLGGGRDRLRINRSRVNFTTFLDGEFQNATISGSKNELRGLLRRRFG